MIRTLCMDGNFPLCSVSIVIDSYQLEELYHHLLNNWKVCKIEPFLVDLEVTKRNPKVRNWEVFKDGVKLPLTPDRIGMCLLNSYEKKCSLTKQCDGH